MKYTLVVLLAFLFSCMSSVNDNNIINSEKLSEFISQKDKTLVYIWTTWCSGCRNSLEETLPKLMQDIKVEEYQLLLIAVSKNRAEVDSLVEVSGLNKNSYFLDFIGPDKGKFQSLGIRKFLSANFKGEKIYNGALPVFFLVNRNKKVLVNKLPNNYDDAIAILK